MRDTPAPAITAGAGVFSFVYYQVKEATISSISA